MGKEVKIKKPLKSAKTLKLLKDTVTKLKKDFDEHLREPSLTIKVKEKNGEWGDWTGIFKLDNEDKLVKLTSKVEEHFQRYFADNTDKEFGLFGNIEGELTFIKIIRNE